jgi:hypothetical protein
MSGLSATGKQNKFYARKNIHVNHHITLCSQKGRFYVVIIMF